MDQRSSHNWKTKSGTWDSMNTRFIDFESDWPLLSSFYLPESLQPINCNDYKGIKPGSFVSTFVDDYILDRFWNRPEYYAHKFRNAECLMSPDYSLLVGMPKAIQMMQVYKNRLVGYIWASHDINVIPTVSWSDESSFEYCFCGVVKNSIVAISNTGCKTDAQKQMFDKGFLALIETINPCHIIFQCTARLRHEYSSDKVIFIDSFFDSKRKLITA